MNSTKQNSNISISAVDLFCGVGGLTHGLANGGIHVAAGIDLDPNCRFPFENNNSAIFLERDIEKLNAEEIRPFLKAGDFSLLAGCAPCQPFSAYSRSRRNKQYASQWPLVLSFGRLIEQLQPDLVTMENVPQLVEHEVFSYFLESLSGYKTWWSVIDCSKYGIPQTRKRLVLMASRLGDKNLELRPTHEVAKTVRETIGQLTPINAGARNAKDPLHIASSLSELNLKRIKASKAGGTWRDWPSELLASCHQKQSGVTYSSVYGRMEWDKPAPTITTQCFGFGNGRFGHPEQNRAISLREAAMLQTFPADYCFTPSGANTTFSKMGRLIGNAVPVRLGEVIAEVLVKHVNKHTQSS